jgi:hypothetical protein
MTHKASNAVGRPRLRQLRDWCRFPARTCLVETKFFRISNHLFIFDLLAVVCLERRRVLRRREKHDRCGGEKKVV